MVIRAVFPLQAGPYLVDQVRIVLWSVTGVAAVVLKAFAEMNAETTPPTATPKLAQVKYANASPRKQTHWEPAWHVLQVKETTMNTVKVQSP